MKVWTSARRWVPVLGALLLCTGVQGRAENGVPAPPPTDVKLLDEVPDYASVLAHQWRDGVPEDVTEAEASTNNYGLLLNAAMQPTTLGDCIALALKNNTNLQIQRLSPIAATAGVRTARSVFCAISTTSSA